ncbi:MAG: tRNA glutamyl-Q(34) synthetase GluQRS [Mariprofundaceae bacterium]|nr:tRNA glutamyl-Q(34) synthetase GluQRS [Mariprofundaceae bacterium]
MTRITRFAPSPTGLMHVGNAFSALICQQWAEQHHARLLLRIEDIDFNRCRGEYTDAIIEDLRWLGVNWYGDVRRQSEHMPAYQRALKRLRDMGMIYPCFCTRRRIQEEINRMSVAPHAEDTVGLYPGTCRKIPAEQQREHMSRQRYAWRLNVASALKRVDKHLSWKDGEGHRQTVKSVMHDDAIIGRKDIGVSYHLAVVVDDAAQGITHVIRGEDLRPFAGLHRLLQALLDLPEPVYIHHPLLNDHAGNRLTKRYGAITIRSLRKAGMQAESLRDILLHSSDFIWHAWQGE